MPGDWWLATAVIMLWAAVLAMVTSLVGIVCTGIVRRRQHRPHRLE